MATIAVPSRAAAQPGLLARLWKDVVEFFVLMANIGTLQTEVERLNATSDAELAARGTTRGEEVSRIFRARVAF